MLKMATLAMTGMLMSASACTTITRGTEEKMRFHTIPEGASVKIDGRDYVSPVDVHLRRRRPHDVTVAKEGYRTIEFVLQPEWDGVSLVGNMFIPGGSLGLVADRLNGSDMSFYKLATIKLVPATQPSQKPMVLKDYKGRLLTRREYAAAVMADREDRAQFFRGEP